MVVELSLGFQGLNGVIPPELGRLEALELLNLTDNRLTGSIPPELGQLQNLHWLNLGVNRLSGSIPPELGNLKNLMSMVFGQNQLSGEIPPELGNLSNLTEMNFGTNLLTGEVPLELAQLTNLRVLHIDTNHLSGCVPDELKKVENHRIGRLIFCADRRPLWDQDPVFVGGVDLGVAFIERLPRYLKRSVAYRIGSPNCVYPFDEFIGVVDCDRDKEVKRWPDPGQIVELIAHVKNYGDEPSGPFDSEWKIDDEIVQTNIHDGLAPGERVTITLQTPWPDAESNPVVTFSIDLADQVEELIEDNNSVTDWINGYTIGFYFSQIAYDSLTFSNLPGRTVQTPEQWVHNNVVRLNEIFADADLEVRVRSEQFFISEKRNGGSDLWRFLDGWWPIWDGTFFTVERYHERPEIDYGLLHELLHQLGVIDLYLIHIGPADVELLDVNRPGEKAGCGPPYWGHYLECFRFTLEGRGLMTDLHIHKISDHTAGALAVNAGFRRGYYGEYLYDTPAITSIKVVDAGGSPMESVALRFYQMAPGGRYGAVIDPIPEFTVTTDEFGRAMLPNRGVTGVPTATGHLLRPNPFGLIDVAGYNSIFIIEMTSDECTNYEWLNITELNLAYWDGQTENAEFTKTLRCPPPR